MDRVAAFDDHRPLLFGIAYRMLGSVMDAEDIVQEAYLRWQQPNGDDVRSPKAYLSTVVTRLCIDQLRSARAQREQYIGPWLPEPLIAESPEDEVAHSESVSMALLVLLESLSPAERAVFVLRDVFDYEYAEIARIVEKSEANCRQMASRARKHVSLRHQRFEASAEQVEELAARFWRASTDGDVAGLVELLAPEATVWSDGGGKVAAALNPIFGAEKVARFFAGLGAKLPANARYRRALVNGAPGIVLYIAGTVYAVMSFEVEDGRMRAARIVNNPEKLRHVPALGA